MKKPIEKTPYHSYKINALPHGCKMCVKGRKLVLFITGLCNRNCFYCPISDAKKDGDVVYANEWDIEYSGGAGGLLSREDYEKIFEEASLCGAKGAGITGGDPLLVTERSADVIKKLKGRFGKKFHIHLYTTPENISKERLELLYEAGLDEIRFHPDFTNDIYWERIELAKKYKWDVGVEIPAIPEYLEETKRMIDYISGRVDFLNINELELSDNTANRLGERGYVQKGDDTYAVSGSEEMALELLEYIVEKGYKFKVHYCTVRLKDRMQLGKRIKKRSKNAATDLDIITAEGLLIRGVIYPEETRPGFSYRKKLKGLSDVERGEMIGKLQKIRENLKKELNLSDPLINVDVKKLRLLTSREIIKRNSERIKSFGLYPAIVEEYPTQDALEVDIEFL